MTEYSTRSTARRAAKAAGLDPDLVARTPSGKFVLPPANKPLAEMTEASRYAMPSAASGLDHSGGEDGGVPAFLQVANRVPLTPEQQAALAARPEAHVSERVDWRKPKGTSWADWDAAQALREAEKRAATAERIAALKDRLPRRTKRLPPPDGSVSLKAVATTLGIKPNLVRRTIRKVLKIPRPAYGWHFSPTEVADLTKSVLQAIAAKATASKTKSAKQPRITKTPKRKGATKPVTTKRSSHNGKTKSP